MDKATAHERNRWVSGDNSIGAKATGGEYGCDHCGGRSATIASLGVGAPVVVQCAACFIAGRDQAKREARAAAGRFMAAMAR